MTVNTKSGISMDCKLIENYFNSLVGMYFKILPLYEKGEKSLRVYMENFRDELEGCGNVIEGINNDPMFMTLISSLQAMIDGIDEEDFTSAKFRQKVFSAISICKKLAARYGEET